MPAMSKTPGRIEHAGPPLGQHNDAVYRDLLGKQDDELEKLASAGVI